MSAIFDKSKLQKSSDYDNSLTGNKLDSKFDSEILRVEKEREKFYNKTKGLFKRAFFRTAFVLACAFVLLGGYVNSWAYDAPMIIGPIMISLVLGLIFGGIYTLIRKGTNNHKFSQILKQDLISKIVTHVNPQLTYDVEGISKEEFDKADLFVGGKHSTVNSEDKISGTIDGKYVCISECTKRGPALSMRKSTLINFKGKTISKSSESLSSNVGEYVDYFRGLFIEIKLDGFAISTPLKFVPRNKITKEVETGIDYTRNAQQAINVNKEDLIDVGGSREYQIYCGDKTQADHLIEDKLLKLVDYIFSKYNKEGAKIFEGIPLLGQLPGLGNLKTSKGVFLSIVDGKLYLALEWPIDMFETDAFLKHSLVESGLAQKIYEDLLFINQLIKEVNLMNKVNV